MSASRPRLFTVFCRIVARILGGRLVGKKAFHIIRHDKISADEDGDENMDSDAPVEGGGTVLVWRQQVEWQVLRCIRWILCTRIYEQVFFSFSSRNHSKKNL